MNYTEFLQEQKAREERSAAKAAGKTAKKPYVRYFSLKDNGDEAIVRFAHTDMNDFEIYHSHNVQVDGKFKRVKCLRENYSDPMSTCPLCASGNRSQDRTYIKLIEYVKSDDGTVTAEPRIWERPAQFLQTISNRYEDYGFGMVYKIKRQGAKGDMKTSYDIMPANASLYNEVTCPNDTTLFDGYEVASTATYAPLQIRTADEMKALIEGKTVTTETPDVNKFIAPKENDFAAGTPFPSMFNYEKYGDPDKTVQQFGGQRRVQY